MTITTRLERHDATLTVIAEWDGAEDSNRPAGPRRLVIELNGDGEPDGITYAVLRRASQLLGDMTGEVNELPAVGGHRAMVRCYLKDRLAALPMDDDAYRRGLRAILEDLARRGEAAPETALADAMHVPETVLRAYLAA